MHQAKKAARGGRLFELASQQKKLSDYDPIAPAPVAVTMAGLAPTELIMPGPSPVVGMDAQPQVGAIGRPTAHAPTIAFVVTNHRSRRRRSCQRQRTRTDKERFTDRVHGRLHRCFTCYENAQARRWFRADFWALPHCNSPSSVHGKCPQSLAPQRLGAIAASAEKTAGVLA
jgi:hypothetical protein